MKLVYIIGEPGIGKTTAMRAFTERYGSPTQREKPVPHLSWDHGVIELGRRRDPFGGTDALSMSIQPAALKWLRTKPAELVLGEGDRLGTASFLDAMASVCDVRVIALVAPPEVAAGRRRDRDNAGQDATWLKGRMTKVERLMPRAARVVDARLRPPAIASAIYMEVVR